MEVVINLVTFLVQFTVIINLLQSKTSGPLYLDMSIHIIAYVNYVRNTRLECVLSYLYWTM